MPKAKVEDGTPRKAAAKRAAKKPAVKAAAPKTALPRAPRKTKSAPEASDTFAAEPAISEAQARVLASKFAVAESSKLKTTPRPTLPGSYGESHLLLLARDPQTLFAAWDVAPATVSALKARIGARAIAVSTFTLRLTREGGGSSVFHVAKKARSRYIKIDGNTPSFVAEIGFTTPAGRFELIARSAPCFVPMTPNSRGETRPVAGRMVIGYREARALVRRGLVPANPGARGRARLKLLLSGGSVPVVTTSHGPSVPRVLGGASDLYRR